MSLLQNKLAIPVIALVVGFGIGAVVYLTNQPGSEQAEAPTQAEASSGENASIVSEAEAQSSGNAPEGSPLITPRVLGDPNAPVLMIEYSSLTCPHCAAFHSGALPEIKERYIDTGMVRLEMRDYPLNEAAAVGALVARCAPEDRYFPLVDLLFAQQNSWRNSQNIVGELARLASFAGMSQQAIEECFANTDLYQAIVDQREVWGATHAVSSTPTFYINGTPVVGNQPFAAFEEVIEDALN